MPSRTPRPSADRSWAASLWCRHLACIGPQAGSLHPKTRNAVGVAALVAIAVVAAATDARAEAGHIRGQVTGPDGLPVAGAVVAAYRWHWPTVKLADVATDADGRYDLALAVPELCNVEARGGAAGPFYIPVCYDRRNGAIASRQDYYDLPAVDPTTGDVEGIDFRLRTIGGAIEGRATLAATGEPLAGMTVTLINDDDGYYADRTTTAADGRYGFYGVRPGRYRAEVVGRAAGIDCVNTYDGLIGDNWQWDNETRATRIDVAAGTLARNIDFRVVLGGVISGLVTKQDTGEPVADAEVNIVQMRPGVEWIAQGTTKADGTYAIGALPPEEYLVTVCPPSGTERRAYQCELYRDIPAGRSDFDLPDGTQVVVLPDASVTGIDFALNPLPHLALSIIPPAGPGVCLRAGDPITIEWTTDATGGDVTFHLRGDHYLSCELGRAPAIDGRLTVLLPPDSHGEAMRIAGSLEYNDEWVSAETEPFCVHSETAPRITVLEPAAGATLLAGSEQVIRWISEQAGDHPLHFMLMEENMWTADLGYAPVSAGQFAWTVPVYLNDASTYNLYALLKGASCVPRTVVEPLSVVGSRRMPAVHVLAPAGDEVLAMGSTTEIRWEFDPPDERVPVQIWLNRAGRWFGQIGAAGAADTSFTWTVSRHVEPGDDYAIEIRPPYSGPWMPAHSSGNCARGGRSAGDIAIVGTTQTRPVIRVTSCDNDLAYGGAQVCVTWEADPALDPGLPATVYLSEMDAGQVPVAQGRLGDGAACFRVPCASSNWSYWRSYAIAVGINGDMLSANVNDGRSVTVHDAWGDADCDADVDVDDFRVFAACFNGANRLPAQGGCARWDNDDDGDVDLADFRTFIQCYNGQNRPPPEACYWIR